MAKANSEKTIDPALLAVMEKLGIDVPASLALLDAVNSGAQGYAPPVRAQGVPPVDGKKIITLGANTAISVKAERAASRLKALGIDFSADPGLAESMPAGLDGKGTVTFTTDMLRRIGIRLFDSTAWGVLNGGSATSYADTKKNAALGDEVFGAIRSGFELLAPMCRNKPKGITPAYINPDGSTGESFLLVKMRIALLGAREYRRRYGPSPREILPFFEMTSEGTRAELASAYRFYASHPWIKDLREETGCDPCAPRSACQPLLAALSHSEAGTPRTIFSGAYGKINSPLALPGGHGQSFAVLAGIYRELLASGYRYAYLGNVDNLGYFPHPVELAVMAITGAEAGFDFSYRTPLDVKGGILVIDQDGRRTVADIGQAISFDEVAALEKSGSKILFNCGTGIFDLERLVGRLEEIEKRLPVRISDQDKDAGRYSQAERSTWEVIGLIDEPLGFAVEKRERFLSAKLLAETVLASTAPGKLPDGIRDLAANLGAGLAGILGGPCGLRLVSGRWTV